jgi:hypothetical protein
MSIPDLSVPRDTTRGTLAKLSIRRDPEGMNHDDLLYDLSVLYTVDVQNHDDLARLENLVPGASTLAQAAHAAGGDRKATVRDTHDAGNLYLTAHEPGGSVALFSGATTELRSSSIKVTGPVTTLTHVYRVSGLDPSDASRLACLLEREVDLTIEHAQQALQFPTASAALANGATTMPRHRGWDGSIGDTVVAGVRRMPDGSTQPVAGVAVEALQEDDGMVLRVEDAPSSAIHYVRSSDVSASIHAAGLNGEPLAATLGRYVMLAENSGTEASWHYLVTALGMTYAEGGVQADETGRWMLTQGVLDRAVQLATDECATA